MKPQIATTIEQSRRLFACGVDSKTADMVWLKAEPPFLSLNRGCNRAIPEVGDVPAWSLSKLIAMLPKLKRNEDMEKCRLSIDSIYGEYCEDNIKDGWEVMWLNGGEINSFIHSDKNYEVVRFRSESLIEACVKAIEFLTANGYSLNKTEE